MSDGVGEVVGGEDRPGGGRDIHRQVGTYFLPVVEEGASRERERREEAGPVERSGELAKREKRESGSHADHPCPASRANESRSHYVIPTLPVCLYTTSPRLMDNNTHHLLHPPTCREASAHVGTCIPYWRVVIPSFVQMEPH